MHRAPRPLILEFRVTQIFEVLDLSHREQISKSMAEFIFSVYSSSFFLVLFWEQFVCVCKAWPIQSQSPEFLYSGGWQVCIVTFKENLERLVVNVWCFLPLCF